MLALELSSYVLEIPNDALQHSALSNSDWLFNTQSRVLRADWWILGNNGKAALNINMSH